MHRLVAISAILAAAVYAQTNRGSITGTVTDASGGTVSGAAVTVTDTGTNQVRKANTSNVGVFTVADLDPVEYTVEVSAAGFKKAVVAHVKVDTASIATISVKLEAGSVDTKVTVEASAVAVDTAS
ncbi:MAG TPA: carboxypeptidase-like regulatory domain-containing protein, partial [Verrucomicrobiae bacterium]|nr:carboxypeptidase-like regulatory domain-containing protein [Verrucomicrobiae bacterium]